MFIEMPVSGQESERSYIYVLEVIYLWTGGIGFPSFYKFSVGFLKCPDFMKKKILLRLLVSNMMSISDDIHVVQH